MNDPKMTYTYRHKQTGDTQQRTFRLSEIKRGEDDAHLELLPDYELFTIECPLCSKFAIAAAAIRGGLNMRGQQGIPNADFFATRQIQTGIDLSDKALEEWKGENPL